MNHDKLKRYSSNFLFYSVLCAAAFFVLVPIIFIILSSFKNETKIFSEPWAMPETFDPSTYISLFRISQYVAYFFSQALPLFSGCFICLALLFLGGILLAECWKNIVPRLGRVVDAATITRLHCLSGDFQFSQHLE
ncbi:MAG: hypothetical protein ACLRZH_08605 [Ruthenibacterium lactatiformans]